MRTLLALAAAALLPACLTCGFEGEGNTMYRRGNDVLLVCPNGGFVQMGQTTYVEGRTASDIDGLRGATGETGALAFQMFEVTSDGSYQSPELGSGWNVVEQTQWDADHTNVLCTDLETRAWWQSAIALPTTTKFASGFESITLAADGTVTVEQQGSATKIGSYAMGAGIGYASFADDTGFTLVYLPDGTLYIGGVGYARVSTAKLRD